MPDTRLHLAISNMFLLVNFNRKKSPQNKLQASTGYGSLLPVAFTLAFGKILTLSQECNAVSNVSNNNTTLTKFIITRLKF